MVNDIAFTCVTKSAQWHHILVVGLMTLILEWVYLTLHDISFYLVDLTWGRAPGAPPYEKASKGHFWGQINQ